MAERVRKQIEGRLIPGDYKIRPERQAFDSFPADHFEYAELHKRPRSVRADRRFLRALIDEIQPVDLTDVTPDRIETLKRKCAQRGHSPTTINMMIRHLSSVFSHAVKRNDPTENPFREVRKLPVDKKPCRFLDKEQIAALLQITRRKGRDIHIVFALGIYAGLGHNEIVNARWEWLDFDHETIAVSPGRD